VIDYLKEYRIGPDGKATSPCFRRDELAAAGMVWRGWAGAGP